MIIFNPGNLGRVDFINEFEYDLFVRPDTCNPRYRWETRGTWHSRHVSWWWVQVLVQLHGGERPHRPENHLQHRQPQQVQEPLQTGPHPPGQVNLEAEMVTNIILKWNNIFIFHFLPFRQRIPRTNVYYYKSPEHNNNYVLSFAFAFDKDGEKYQFAMSYPYTYSRCRDTGYMENSLHVASGAWRSWTRYQRIMGTSSPGRHWSGLW